MFGLSIIASVVFTITLTVVVESAPKPLDHEEIREQMVPQVADAKFNENGMLMLRFRRSPQRAMTFSGFMPNGVMTAFSAAADSYQPSWYRKPSDTLSPPLFDNEQLEQEEPQPKKPKKKPVKFYPENTANEDEEEYVPSSKSKSKNGGGASASFNAWFPIVIGSFPNQQQGGSQFGRNGASDQSKPNGDSYSPLNRASEYPGQTVIANSVSNGRGGVASSHAVAYGTGQQGRYYGQNNYDNQGLNGQDQKGSQGQQQSYY